MKNKIELINQILAMNSHANWSNMAYSWYVLTQFHHLPLTEYEDFQFEDWFAQLSSSLMVRRFFLLGDLQFYWDPPEESIKEEDLIFLSNQNKSGHEKIRLLSEMLFPTQAFEIEYLPPPDMGFLFLCSMIFSYLIRGDRTYKLETISKHYNNFLKFLKTYNFSSFYENDEDFQVLLDKGLETYLSGVVNSFDQIPLGTPLSKYVYQKFLELSSFRISSLSNSFLRA